MSTPATGDLLIQRLPGLPTEFVISDAVTRRTLASGYPRFEDAVAHALTHAAKMRVAVWQLSPAAPGDPERFVAIVPEELPF